jgi:mannobiose 2-epimerase
MSLTQDQILTFRDEIAREWRDNIAPFWLRYAPDEEYGGFRGLITNDLAVDQQAEKGIILNSRILWTFAHAFRNDRKQEFRHLAERAFSYVTDKFIDQTHGGVFWTLDWRGQPVETKKRPYAQAFAIYGLTEFFLATGVQRALDEAMVIFELLENRARDNEHDGYFETFERDWSLATDQRLSEVDQDEKKSMNTHLHLLEAYAALLSATNDSQVKERLRALINIFLNKIIQPGSCSLQMFFSESWQGRSDHTSFGHDIEASWLLGEAAQILDDRELLVRVNDISSRMAQSVYEHGLDEDGSLLYEADSQGIINDEKHWWTQTEAVVGFVNAYEVTGETKFLLAAIRVWEFIKQNLVDRQNGEWFWKTSRSGAPDYEMPKLSQWKGPYHNGRMCFEIARRLAVPR